MCYSIYTLLNRVSRFWFKLSRSTASNFQKVQVGNDQEMAQSERNSHSTNRGVGKKTKMTLRYLYQKLSEQLFPKRRPLSYPNLTKNMKTYIRLKQQKNRLQNTKQLEPPQKYRLGTISNMKLLGGGIKPVLEAPYLTLIFCSGSEHLFSCSVLVVNL